MPGTRPEDGVQAEPYRDAGDRERAVEQHGPPPQERNPRRVGREGVADKLRLQHVRCITLHGPRPPIGPRPAGAHLGHNGPVGLENRSRPSRARSAGRGVGAGRHDRRGPPDASVRTSRRRRRRTPAARRAAARRGHAADPRSAAGHAGGRPAQRRCATPPIACATLGAEPASAAGPAILDAALRTALRAAAGTVVRRRPPPPTARASTRRPLLALLSARAPSSRQRGARCSPSRAATARPGKEPVYGGHASAMGPAPAAAARADDDAPRRLRLPSTRARRLPTRTWNGGPTKDHILESPGNGVALVDEDGDGWLDIYLVTAAQLDASRGAHSPPQRALSQPR